eukprot:3439260-Prymnesium_polylepis.1
MQRRRPPPSVRQRVGEALRDGAERRGRLAQHRRRAQQLRRAQRAHALDHVLLLLVIGVLL